MIPNTKLYGSAVTLAIKDNIFRIFETRIKKKKSWNKYRSGVTIQ